VLLTTPMKAEMIAETICKTFDQVAPKFYAPYEAERGYTIISDMGKASRKAPLVSVNIGIGSSEHKNISDYKTAISIANNMKDLVKYKIGSGWLIDRPQIGGEESININNKKNYVLIIESDAALAYLLTTTLEMQGYKVDATTNRDDAINLINSNKPDLVLIDAVLPADDGWEICSYIKNNNNLNRTKIIMATVLHDKEKAFSSGADLYIPKPYELMFLHKWISKLIQDNYY
ncbi:MAG: response regulator transcription factor, partial [Vampirovibrionia bacterium]